ncbi:hypothetical protein V8E36_005070 [Tilletia maclaganii]
MDGLLPSNAAPSRRPLNASQQLLSEVLSGGDSASSGSRKRRKTRHQSQAEQVFSQQVDPEANASTLASHLGRVSDGTTLVLTNPARARPIPDPASKEGRQLRKRDRRVEERIRREGSGSRARNKVRRKAGGPGKKVDAAEDPGKADPVTTAAKSNGSGRKRAGFLDSHPDLSYAMLQPLASLWEAYIQTLLGLRSDPALSQGSSTTAPHSLLQQDAPGAWNLREGAMIGLQTTLSKVDLTGASIRVIRCSDPARVGLKGLVARETENILLIAVEPVPALSSSGRETRTARSHTDESLRQRRSEKALAPRSGKGSTIRTVPKHNTVFELLIPLPSSTNKDISSSKDEATVLAVPLYGNQMAQSYPTRATRKHKARKSVDF